MAKRARRAPDAHSEAAPLHAFAGSRTLLALVLALAAALRLGHVLSLRSLPLFDTLIVDSALYDAWARRIAAGDWLGGTGAFFMDPLYSYVLAVVYRVLGHDLLVVRLLQIALGVGTCALVAWIGRRVAGPAVGNGAALLLAVYRPAIFQEAEVEKTALGVFLVTAALALALAHRPAARLGAGACLGLAALTRGNLLLLAPLGVLWLLFDTPEAAPGERPAWRARLTGSAGRGAAAFLAGFLAVVSVVAVRNHHVSGEWILTTAHGGQNFYTGNNPANRTGAYEYVPFVRPEPQFEQNDFHAEAEARTGRRMTSREVSTFWFGAGLRHIAERPGWAARLFLKKLVLFWSDFEMPDAWDMYFLARYSPVLRLPLLGMGLLLPLAVLGAAAGFRRRREIRLLTGFALVYSASVIAFFIFSRYRLHVVPALTVLAACGVVWAVDVARARDARRAAAGALAACGVAAFSFLASRSFDVGPREDPQSAISLAWLYRERGEYRAAERLLVEALAAQRDGARAGPLCALGDLHLRERDVDRAVGALEECARANPAFPNALVRLGIAYEARGWPDRARAAYELQLQIVPGNDDARLRLMRLLGAGP